MAVAEKTGWSKHDIMHNHSFVELHLMMADAPRMQKKKSIDKFENDEELKDWVSDI